MTAAPVTCTWEDWRAGPSRPNVRAVRLTTWPGMKVYNNINPPTIVLPLPGGWRFMWHPERLCGTQALIQFQNTAKAALESVYRGVSFSLPLSLVPVVNGREQRDWLEPVRVRGWDE